MASRCPPAPATVQHDKCILSVLQWNGMGAKTFTNPTLQSSYKNFMHATCPPAAACNMTRLSIWAPWSCNSFSICNKPFIAACRASRSSCEVSGAHHGHDIISNQMTQFLCREISLQRQRLSQLLQLTERVYGARSRHSDGWLQMVLIFLPESTYQTGTSRSTLAWLHTMFRAQIWVHARHQTFLLTSASTWWMHCTCAATVMKLSTEPQRYSHVICWPTWRKLTMERSSTRTFVVLQQYEYDIYVLSLRLFILLGCAPSLRDPIIKWPGLYIWHLT